MNKPKVSPELLDQLLQDATQKARKMGHGFKDLEYCGHEKCWEDCVIFEDALVVLYFNIGVDTFAVLRKR